MQLRVQEKDDSVKNISLNAKCKTFFYSAIE